MTRFTIRAHVAQYELLDDGQVVDRFDTWDAADTAAADIIRDERQRPFSKARELEAYLVKSELHSSKLPGTVELLRAIGMFLLHTNEC